MKKGMVIGIFILGIILINLAGVVSAYSYSELCKKEDFGKTLERYYICEKETKTLSSGTYIWKIRGSNQLLPAVDELPVCDEINEVVYNTKFGYLDCTLLTTQQNVDFYILSTKQYNDGFYVDEVFIIETDLDTAIPFLKETNKYSKGITTGEFEWHFNNIGPPSEGGCYVYSREYDLVSSDDFGIGRIKTNFVFDGTTINDKYKKFENIYSSGGDGGVLIKDWVWGFENSHDSYVCRDDGYWYSCDSDSAGKEIISKGQTFKCEKEVRTLTDNKNSQFDFYMWKPEDNCKGIDITETGTSASPYKITCCSELQDINNNNLNAYYELANDIDCSISNYWSDPIGNKGFNPIGNENKPFTGSFDGKGHKISNLFIERNNWDGVGLFGYVESSGAIKNVELINSKIKGTNYVGCLAGQISRKIGENFIEISNVGCTGSITGTGNNVGGLVGDSTGYISQSYFKGSVSGNNNIGGLVGQNGVNAKIINSYSKGSVNGNSKVGGLVGDHFNGLIDKDYSISEINGKTKSTTGGLIGKGEESDIIGGFGQLKNSFFAGSVINGYGLVGEKGSVTITNNYRYSQIVGGGSSISILSDTSEHLCIGITADMKSQSGCYLVNQYNEYKFDYNGGILTITDPACYFQVMFLVPYSSSGSFKLQLNSDNKCLTTGNIGIDYFKGLVRTVKKNEPFIQWDFVNIWSEVTNDFPKLKWEIPVTPTIIKTDCGNANGKTDIATEEALRKVGLCADKNTEGNVISDKTTTPNKWKWSCAGTDGIIKACEAYALSSTPTSKVGCGASNNKILTESPSNDLCVLGNTIEKSPTPIAGGWKWTCKGTGTTKDCSATKATCVSPNSCEATCISPLVQKTEFTCPTDKPTCCGTPTITCTNGETKCVGTHHNVCENNIWADKGEIVDKCGVTEPTPSGKGVCGSKVVNMIKFDYIEDLDEFILDNQLCDKGEVSPKESSETEKDYSLTESSKSGIEYTAEWYCGTKSCSVDVIEPNPGPGIQYSLIGDCDTDNFMTVSYEGTNRKVYCPAPLPFFTLTNIVAVLVIVGVFYFFMNARRGSGKKRKK